MAVPNGVTGNIPSIVENDERLYEGDLAIYFRVVWFAAKNLNNPYHNARHLLHVLWLCHEACKYYREQFTPRKMRNLLIAALFHDFDHSGKAGQDIVNIEQAIKGLDLHILPEDRPFFDEISGLIGISEYPYRITSGLLNLQAQILRDADLCQALDPAWIQQVIFGLAAEWKIEPIEVLRKQTNFFRAVGFSTQWAREKFPKEKVEEKIAEAVRLLTILERKPPAEAVLKAAS